MTTRPKKSKPLRGAIKPRLHSPFLKGKTRGGEVAELADISPSVPHNVSNALAASALALSIGISHEFIKEGLKKFTPDHHRMELVLEKDEIKQEKFRNLIMVKQQVHERHNARKLER